MAKVSTKKIISLKYKVRAVMGDHQRMVDGNCNDPRTCRWKVANHRALEALGMGPVTKVWVDAGHIRFSLGGWRWSADTPKQIKGDLIRLDKWVRLPASIRAATPVPFDPSAYTVTAIRKSPVRKATAEQSRKMAERRRRRVASGKPDKPRPGVHRHTFHDRVVGYA